MTKSFSLIELIIVLLLIGIMSSQSILKNNLSKIKLAKKQIILHLKYTRYIAMIDNKFQDDDPLWFRKRWTVKFLNCNKNIGGLYYIIYSDSNENGYISKKETLKDPLTNQYIYSYQCKEDTQLDKNSMILLTKRYGIEKIKISCNSTSTIGQISFGSNGEIYSRLSNKEYDSDKYKLEENCIISIYDKNDNIEEITIDKNTGTIK
jgi:hypothetical protein